MSTASDGKQRDLYPICVNVKLQFVFNNERINNYFFFFFVFCTLTSQKSNPNFDLLTKLLLLVILDNLCDVLMNFLISIW